MVGIILLVVSPAFKLPWKLPPPAYDGLCVPTSLDGSLFLDNVSFNNFKLSYSEPGFE